MQSLKHKLQAVSVELEKANHKLSLSNMESSESKGKIKDLEKIIEDYRTETEPGKNELVTWFAQREKGPGLDKWSRYLDAYHRHFNRFRVQDKITIVEVGVQSGGSIEMWRSYFGADKLK